MQNARAGRENALRYCTETPASRVAAAPPFDSRPVFCR
jgi:hypothetical protein